MVSPTCTCVTHIYSQFEQHTMAGLAERERRLQEEAMLQERDAAYYEWNRGRYEEIKGQASYGKVNLTSMSGLMRDSSHLTGSQKCIRAGTPIRGPENETRSG